MERLTGWIARAAAVSAVVAGGLLMHPNASSASECRPPTYIEAYRTGSQSASVVACDYQAFYCNGSAAEDSRVCSGSILCGEPYQCRENPKIIGWENCAFKPETCSSPAFDSNCNGNINEHCAPCKTPFAGGPQNDEGGDCCHSKAGADPILLSSRAAATEPFTDFGVDRVSRLSITRTYNSSDHDLTSRGTGGGVFASGWHHDWEAYLTCSGDVCTVARGTLSGFQFSYWKTVPSADGSELVDVFGRHAVHPFTPPHRNVLVRRPSGEWSAFLTDGRELRFATVCTGCDSATSPYCVPADQGGRARLVKVVDSAGNGIAVGYLPAEGVLLRLTDDLGHALELRGAGSCAAYASELRYDGETVARYSVAASMLTSVSDADDRATRSYVHGSIGLRWPRLMSVLNEAGDAIAEFSYDAAGNAIGVVDASSSVDVWYSPDGQASMVTEFYRGPLGDISSSTSRVLDPFGHVTIMAGECSCGSAQQLKRAPSGQVECSIDADDHVVLQAHDGYGRLAYRLEYTGRSCEVPEVLPLDSKEEWRTYGVARTVAEGVSVGLDVPTQVWRRSVVAAGEFVSDAYDYDQAPSPLDPPGYSCTAAPLPAGSVVCREIRSGYVTGDAGAQLERHATFYSYDAKGRLVRSYGPVSLDHPGAQDVTPIEERTYWADGETSARQGRLHEVKRYAAPTAQPLVTAYDYGALGISRIVHPDGSRTVIARDGRGRPTVVSQLDATGATRASEETRYHDGLAPRLRILAGGAAERYSYDARGRLSKVERLSADPEASGANPLLAWTEQYGYDQAGNRIHAERADAAGRVTWRQDRAYDVQHHVVWESNPDLPAAARTWAYSSSGFLLEAIDEEGRGTAFTPDGLNRVGKVRRAGPDAYGSPASVDVATYAYQGGGDALAGVLDANGRSTGYSYDDFGRVERVSAATLAQGGARWFRYDARGNVVERGDSNVTVAFTYDGLDRMRTMSAVNSGDGSSVAYAYIYDEAPYPGMLTSILEPDRIVTYGYDWAGRVATEESSEPGMSAPLTTQYGYDAIGALVRIDYPSGLVVSFVRDPTTGEVTAIENALDGSVIASDVTHLPLGPVASLTFGNGRSLVQTFTLRGEPLGVASGPVRIDLAPTPSGDVGLATDTSEDPSGCGHASTRTFRYDLLDRLAAWSDSVSAGSNSCPAETLGPIAAGFTYVDGTDLLAAQWIPDVGGAPAYAFAYDLEGNVSAIGQYDAGSSSIASAVCLRHDPLGRLSAVGYTSTALVPGGLGCVSDEDMTGTIARYRYDSRNLRVRRDGEGESVYFVADLSGNPLSELARSGDPAHPWIKLRDYVWLDGRLVAEVEYVSGVAHAYYAHLDHLGTPRALTNANGALVWSTFQRPYGEVGEKATTDLISGRTVVTNLRLPGQYDERLLGSLGLQGPYYSWNRWYLPGVGRYLELDPIALQGGFNGRGAPDWYNYALGNPLRYTDPTGEFVPVVIGGVIVAGWVVDAVVAAGLTISVGCAMGLGPCRRAGPVPWDPQPRRPTLPWPRPAPGPGPGLGPDIIPIPEPPDPCDDNDECDEHYKACIQVAGTPGVGKYISAEDCVQCERDCRFGNTVPKGTWPSRTQCDYKHAGYN